MTSKLYENFADYYDTIFPENSQTTFWLKNTFNGKRYLLDIACGTGTYALSLAKLGFHVEGFDLDQFMIEKAKLKASSLNLTVTFNQKDMLTLNSKNTYEGVYCIGNSLVHLPNESVISDMLEKIYQALKKNGKIIIQTINYDRILDQNINALPTIEHQEIKFIRKYHYSDPYIDFETTLITPLHQHHETTKLYPLRMSELKNMLIKHKFKHIKFYQGFSDEPFNITDSFHSVITAIK